MSEFTPMMWVMLVIGIILGIYFGYNAAKNITLSIFVKRNKISDKPYVFKNYSTGLRIKNRSIDFEEQDVRRGRQSYAKVDKEYLEYFRKYCGSKTEK